MRLAALAVLAAIHVLILVSVQVVEVGVARAVPVLAGMLLLAVGNLLKNERVRSSR